MCRTKKHTKKTHNIYNHQICGFSIVKSFHMEQMYSTAQSKYVFLGLRFSVTQFLFISILAASWKVFVAFLQFSTHKNPFLAQFWTLLYRYFVKFGCKNCISNNYLMQNMHTISNKLSSILLIAIITQQILHLIHVKWVFKWFPYIYSVNWKVAFFNKRYQLEGTRQKKFIKVTADIVRCIISNILMYHIWVFISYKRI